MHNEFMAIIERDEGWFIAYCPEIPGANGQGRTMKIFIIAQNVLGELLED